MSLLNFSYTSKIFILFASIITLLLIIVGILILKNTFSKNISTEQKNIPSPTMDFTVELPTSWSKENSTQNSMVITSPEGSEIITIAHISKAEWSDIKSIIKDAELIPDREIIDFENFGEPNVTLPNHPVYETVSYTTIFYEKVIHFQYIAFTDPEDVDMVYAFSLVAQNTIFNKLILPFEEVIKTFSASSL